MPKSREITTEQYEALSEAQREFYVSGKDGYLLDAEGYEDVSGLKSALNKQKEESKRAKEELRKLADLYKDLDPEKAHEALNKQKEYEEKELIDKGKLDEVYEKRFASREKALQAKIEALTADLGVRDQAAKALTDDLARASRSGELGKALIQAQVDPKWFEYVEMKAERIWHWASDERKLVPMEGEDPLFIDGKVPDMKTWITANLAKTRPDILLPSSGGGAAGSNGRSGNGIFSISRADAKDVRKYEAVKAQAEKAGVPLSQIQVTE